MKKILASIVFVLVFSFGVSAFAGIENWKVAWTRPTKSRLRRMIGRNMNKKWIPVGVSYRRGKIFVLFIKNRRNTLKIRRWNLSWYRTLPALKRGLTSKIRMGWLPMGFTQGPKKVWVIYIKGRIKTRAWKIVRAYNLGQFRRKIRINARLGWFPVGVTDTKKAAYILFIRDRSFRGKMWQLKRHSNTTRIFKRQVDRQKRYGWIPWTFTYRKNKVFMFYWKSRPRGM